MTNLRRVFDRVMVKYGHDVYLQRRTSPFDSETITFDAKLERHTVRYTNPAAKRSAQVAQEQLEGVAHESEMIYYFRHDANPKEGDRIYENIEQYPNSLATYIIDSVTPLRLDRGRIEYWMVGASREEPDV